MSDKIHPTLGATHGIPDPAHRAKNLDQSHANWFLAVEGGRFNRVLLRTLRNKDTSVSERLRKAVSDKSLRRRDRMDTLDVTKSTSPAIQRILEDIEVVIHTLSPEQFRKGDEKKSEMMHPVYVCRKDPNILFVSDYGKNVVYKARLHYPVEMEKVGGHMKSPMGIFHCKGVLFVCAHGINRLMYIDLQGVVTLNTKQMKKSDLEKALADRGIKTDGMKNIELREKLNEWITNEGGKVKESNWKEVKLDSVILEPMALSGYYDESTGWVLFISSIETDSVLKVSVSSNGAVLTGTVSKLIGNPGMKVTGMCLSFDRMYFVDNHKGLVCQCNIQSGVCNTPWRAYDIDMLGNGNLMVSTEHHIISISYEDGEWRELKSLGSTF